MLHIRRATLHDVPLPRTMICELAEAEHELDLVAIREEDLARDGFGENPRFRAIIAEWDGHVAGYALFLGIIRRGWAADCFWKICSRGRCSAGAELGRPCWPRSPELRPGNIVTEYAGKGSTGMIRRSRCTRRWARLSVISGGPCC